MVNIASSLVSLLQYWESKGRNSYISIYMQEFPRTTMASKVAFTKCSYIKSFIQCVQKINWIDNNTFLIELQHWSYFTVADIEQNVDWCKEICIQSIIYFIEIHTKKTNTGHASHAETSTDKCIHLYHTQSKRNPQIWILVHAAIVYTWMNRAQLSLPFTVKNGVSVRW